MAMYLVLLLSTTSHDAEPPSTYLLISSATQHKRRQFPFWFWFKLQTRNFPDMDTLLVQEF